MPVNFTQEIRNGQFQILISGPNATAFVALLVSLRGYMGVAQLSYDTKVRREGRQLSGSGFEDAVAQATGSGQVEARAICLLIPSRSTFLGWIFNQKM